MQEKNNFRTHDIVWTDEEITNLWDYYSNHLAEERYFSFHSGKYILDYVNRFVVRSNIIQNVLDFGCGPGYFIEQLMRNYSGLTHGLDFSEEAVRKVNERFASNEKFGGAAYVNKLPSTFAGGSMDLVIAVEVLEHLDDKQTSEALIEIYRLLKPGGYVVITVPNSEDLTADKTVCPECGCVFHQWQHMRNFTLKGLISMMERSSFVTAHCAATTFEQRNMISVARKLYHSLFLKNKKEPSLIYIGIKK